MAVGRGFSRDIPGDCKTKGLQPLKPTLAYAFSALYVSEYSMYRAA
jgi:hypothetical protein